MTTEQKKDLPYGYEYDWISGKVIPVTNLDYFIRAVAIIAAVSLIGYLIGGGVIAF